MVKIKVPQKIRFLTHTYTISFAPKQLASAGAGGLTRHLYQEIILDDTCNPKSEVDQVFLHEYLHILERHMGMKLEDADIERITEGLSDLLFNTLGIELDWAEIKELST